MDVSNSSISVSHNYTIQQANERLDAYIPLEADDKTATFFRALLEYSPAKENIVKEICQPSSKDNSSVEITADATLRLRYFWWVEHLMVPCMSSIKYHGVTTQF